MGTRTKWLELILGALLAAALNAPPAAAQTSTGWGLVVNADGEIFTCDLHRNKVWKVDRGGGLTLLRSQTHCHSLTIDAAGNIYGEQVGFGSLPDSGKLALWKLSPNGEFNYIVPPTAEPPEEFGFVRDAAGNMYAWSGNQQRNVSHILKRTPAGEVTVLAGGEWGYADGRGSEARLGLVGGLAVGPDGTVYFTDSGNLRRIGSDGNVATIARGVVSEKVGGVPGFIGLYNRSMGMIVDDRGGVYIVDREPGHVLKIAPDGKQTAIPCGWGHVPTGVAVVGNDLYIREDLEVPDFVAGLIGSPRIRRISVGGDEVTVAVVANRPVRAASAAFLTAVVAGILLLRRRHRNRDRRS